MNAPKKEEASKTKYKMRWCKSGFHIVPYLVLYTFSKLEIIVKYNRDHFNGCQVKIMKSPSAQCFMINNNCDQY